MILTTMGSHFLWLLITRTLEYFKATDAESPTLQMKLNTSFYMQWERCIW